jgi:WD40 repeat protein
MDTRTVVRTAARLWNLIARDPAASRVVLLGHEGAVDAVTISSDNHWLVTGSVKKKGRAFGTSRPDSAISPVVLRGNQGVITAVATSSDNHWLATGGQDFTTRLWPLKIKDLIDLARATVSRNLTTEEWKLYFPGGQYHKSFRIYQAREMRTSRSELWQKAKWSMLTKGAM